MIEPRPLPVTIARIAVAVALSVTLPLALHTLYRATVGARLPAAKRPE